MQYAYQAAAWHDLFICVGSASTALAGLIFVALSLHLSPIMGNPVWSLIAGWFGGLFWAVATVVAFYARVVFQSWRLAVSIAEEGDTLSVQQ